MDILGPLPETKLRHKYIITAIDTCTCYLFAQALKRIRIEETIKFLKIIFSEKGILRVIQTDNGKNFVSTEFQDFLKLYSIIHKRSIYFHPQSQGMVERMNKTLCERLRIYCQQIEEWDLKLKEIIMGINSNINKIARKSLFYLMHGFEQRTRLINEWNICDSRISDNIEQDRQDSNIRTEEEQEKTLSRRNKPDRSSQLKTGDNYERNQRGQPRER